MPLYVISPGGGLRGDDLEPGEMGFPAEKGELPQVGKREGGLLEKEDWPGVCPSRTGTGDFLPHSPLPLPSAASSLLGWGCPLTCR